MIHRRTIQFTYQTRNLGPLAPRILPDSVYSLATQFVKKKHIKKQENFSLFWLRTRLPKNLWQVAKKNYREETRRNVPEYFPRSASLPSRVPHRDGGGWGGMRVMRDYKSEDKNDGRCKKEIDNCARAFCTTKFS